jgi:glycosyltransferase involved in cell wall biosynthesis
VNVAVHTDQLWSAVPGGIGTYIRELVTALAALEAPPDLVLFHARFPGANPWDPGLPEVEVPGTPRSLYPQWNLFGRPTLPEALGEADVVHAPLPAAVPPVRPDQALVVTVHDLAFLRFPRMFPARWRWLYRAGLRATARRANAVIVPSRATAEDLLGRTSVDPSIVHVVPEAATLHRFEADPAGVMARLGISAPYILAVGTVEPRKNLVRLIRAYRHLARRSLPHTLVIAGPIGWGAEPVLREAASNGPGRVVVTGRLTDEELDAAYRGAWCAAYLSVCEGFGLPVLEAMARGIPVIASNRSSVPEVAGDAAVLVDPGSVSAIAGALEDVCRDDRLATDLSSKGMERSRQFTWEEAARRTRAVYEKA